MSEKEYAFPNGFQPESCECDHGMTLRDYFAAKALPACVAAFMEAGDAWDNYDDLAKSVWSIADAMLRAREAK